MQHPKVSADVDPGTLEAPETRDAIAKAEHFAALAKTESDPTKKAYFDRMSRKWRGIAEGYRFIAEIGQHR